MICFSLVDLRLNFLFYKSLYILLYYYVYKKFIIEEKNGFMYLCIDIFLVYVNFINIYFVISGICE